MDRLWIPNRRSIRLPAYDYSRPGIYYVTMVVNNRKCIFGDVVNNRMNVNVYGWLVETCWLDLINHYKNIRLDKFIVMPNRFHGIIEIIEPAPTTKNKRPTLHAIIRSFKSYSSMRINNLREMTGSSVWQRNYYERIIRDEAELNRTREYIKDNPGNWDKDENHI